MPLRPFGAAGGNPEGWLLIRCCRSALRARQKPNRRAAQVKLAAQLGGGTHEPYSYMYLLFGSRQSPPPRPRAPRAAVRFAYYRSYDGARRCNNSSYSASRLPTVLLHTTRDGPAEDAIDPRWDFIEMVRLGLQSERVFRARLAGEQETKTGRAPLGERCPARPRVQCQCA